MALLHLSRDTRAETLPCRREELVDNIFSLVSRQLEQDDMVFSTTIAPMLPQLKANPQQVGQLLLNLVHNGKYALNEKCSGKNQVKLLQTVAKEVSGGNDSVFRRLTVCDNGTGIAPELLARVTTPFVTTRPTGVGAAPGLSLCQEIVCRHGGSLRTESEYGIFTRIIVELPFAEA